GGRIMAAVRGRGHESFSNPHGTSPRTAPKSASVELRGCLDSSRHTPCAVASRAEQRRHTECAYYYQDTLRNRGGTDVVPQIRVGVAGTRRVVGGLLQAERSASADGRSSRVRTGPRGGEGEVRRRVPAARGTSAISADGCYPHQQARRAPRRRA